MSNSSSTVKTYLGWLTLSQCHQPDATSTDLSNTSFRAMTAPSLPPSIASKRSLPIREGMVALSRASVTQARQTTNRLRGKEYGNLLDVLNGPNSATRRSFQHSINTTRSGLDRPRLPFIVLFTDKPSAEWVVMAPLVMGDGWRGVADLGERQWHFPIIGAPTLQAASLSPGEEEMDQEIVEPSNWSSLRERDEALAGNDPYYLVLGLPVTGLISDLKADGQYERFHLNQTKTEWCQKKCISFMTDDERDLYSLSPSSP